MLSKDWYRVVVIRTLRQEFRLEILVCEQRLPLRDCQPAEESGNHTN